MRDDNAGTVIFVIIIFALAMFFIGSVVGVTYAGQVEREKFIIYCTSKGDDFKTCDAIFYGREVKNELG
jgi:uncharacterized membrane protein